MPADYRTDREYPPHNFGSYISKSPLLGCYFGGLLMLIFLLLMLIFLLLMLIFLLLMLMLGF